MQKELDTATDVDQKSVEQKSAARRGRRLPGNAFRGQQARPRRSEARLAPGGGVRRAEAAARRPSRALPRSRAETQGDGRLGRPRDHPSRRTHGPDDVELACSSDSGPETQQKLSVIGRSGELAKCYGRFPDRRFQVIRWHYGRQTAIRLSPFPANWGPLYYTCCPEVVGFLISPRVDTRSRLRRPTPRQFDPILIPAKPQKVVRATGERSSPCSRISARWSPFPARCDRRSPNARLRWHLHIFVRVVKPMSPQGLRTQLLRDFACRSTD